MRVPTAEARGAPRSRALRSRERRYWSAVSSSSHLARGARRDGLQPALGWLGGKRPAHPGGTGLSRAGDRWRPETGCGRVARDRDAVVHGRQRHLPGMDAVSERPTGSLCLDIAYLAIYPCVAVALVRLIRGGGGPLTRSLWLDGALGAAGGATALAAVLSPVLSGVDGDLGEALVGAAYPTRRLATGRNDLRAAGGARPTRGIDVALAGRRAGDLLRRRRDLCAPRGLRQLPGRFRAGRALGHRARAHGASIWRPDRPGAIKSGGSTAILAIPLLATLTAVVVLVISSFSRLSVVAVAFATFTLVLAALRTLVGFRQVQGLSDARRQALTDDLTGLGNRRSLFEYGGSVAPALMTAAGWHCCSSTSTTSRRSTTRSVITRAMSCCARSRAGSRRGWPPPTARPAGGARVRARHRARARRRWARDRGTVLDRVSQPLVLEGVRVRIDASVGLAVPSTRARRRGTPAPRRRRDVRGQGRRLARRALRAAPRRGHAPARDGPRRSKLRSRSRDEFVLALPAQDRRQRPARVAGAEALVRWQHPTRGLVYPDAFIPQRRADGLMSAADRVGSWTRRSGSSRTGASAGLDITVAVNLSASRSARRRPRRRSRRAARRHGRPAVRTGAGDHRERAHADPRARARRARASCASWACGSPSTTSAPATRRSPTCSDLPIDELKIDRSFVARMAADERERGDRALHHRARAHLDLKVVAEGVENAGALDALAAPRL